MRTNESFGLSAVPRWCLEAKRRRVSLTAFVGVIWPRPRCPRIEHAVTIEMHRAARHQARDGRKLQGHALHAKLRTIEALSTIRPAVVCGSALLIFSPNSASGQGTCCRALFVCSCTSAGVLDDSESYMYARLYICTYAYVVGMVYRSTE